MDCLWVGGVNVSSSLEYTDTVGLGGRKDIRHIEIYPTHRRRSSEGFVGPDLKKFGCKGSYMARSPSKFSLK